MYMCIVSLTYNVPTMYIYTCMCDYTAVELISIRGTYSVDTLTFGDRNLLLSVDNLRIQDVQVYGIRS